jgi:hypothetical protein
MTTATSAFQGSSSWKGSGYDSVQTNLSGFQTLKSRLVAGFSVTGLVSFWLSAPIRKSARYEEALVR